MEKTVNSKRTGYETVMCVDEKTSIIPIKFQRYLQLKSQFYPNTILDVNCLYIVAVNSP